MRPRYRLPAPAHAVPLDWRSRTRRFLWGTVRGRALVAAFAVFVLEQLGLRLPSLVSIPLRVLLWGYGLYFGFKLSRFVLRWLLWRIRSKLMLSYAFIGLVPVVLLTLFFVSVGAFLTSLVASHTLAADVDHTAELLESSLRGALSDLDVSTAGVGARLEARLTSARELHPEVAYALVRDGRVLASSGDVVGRRPGWVQGESWAGVVRDGKRNVVRGLAERRGVLLVVDLPVSAPLFARLERRSGIEFMLLADEAEQTGQKVRLRIEERARREAQAAREPVVGGRWIERVTIPFFTLIRRVDWTDGRRADSGVLFRFRPASLINSLATGPLNPSDLLFKVMASLGTVFLLAYVPALVTGVLLARSITRNVHALHQGTLRLRRGELDHRISLRGRDQLRDLAESFNLMAQGLEDLVREQGEKQRLEEELRIARQIQMSLLPAGTVAQPGLRVAALCIPATEVGGDYYDLLPLSDTRLAVVVADVSGKGTSAALYMAELKGLVLSLSRVYDSPARLLCEANRILAEHLDPRSFITMTYAIVDTAAGVMRYARAGHNPTIHLEAASGRARLLTPAGMGLGLDAGERFEELLREGEVPLVRGDVFVFFTDGVSEAMGPQAEQFGELRLMQLIEECAGAETEVMRQNIVDAVRGFAGGVALHDDVTIVVLKVA